MQAVKIYTGRGAREIGGNQFIIKSGDATIQLDCGLPMDTLLSSNFGGGPRVSHAARDWLEFEEIPKLQGWLRNTFAKHEGDHGLSPTDKPLVDALIISHAHQDHVNGIPFMHEKTQVLSGAITRRDLEISEETGFAQGFLNDIIRIREWPRALPKEYEGYTAMIDENGERDKVNGKQYLIIGRPISYRLPGTKDYIAIPKTSRLERGEPRPWKVGGELKVGGIRVRMEPVDHSTPSNAILWNTPELSGAYSGDVRKGPATDRFFDKARGVDILLIEGTGVAKKRSMSIERFGELMYEEFTKEESSAWKIALLSKNDMPTTLQIMKAAERAGLLPLASPEHAYFMLQRGVTKGIGIWRRDRDDFTTLKKEFKGVRGKKSYLKKVRDQFEVFSDKNVIEGHGRYVEMLTRTPRDLLKIVDWKPAGGVFVNTTTEPWDEETRTSQSRMVKFINTFATLRHSLIHTSGHAIEEELLDWIARVNAKVTMLIHVGNEPDENGVMKYMRYEALVRKRVPNTIPFVPLRGETYDLVAGQPPTRSDAIAQSMARTEILYTPSQEVVVNQPISKPKRKSWQTNAAEVSGKLDPYTY